MDLRDSACWRSKKWEVWRCWWTSSFQFSLWLSLSHIGWYSQYNYHIGRPADLKDRASEELKLMPFKRNGNEDELVHFIFGFQLLLSHWWPFRKLADILSIINSQEELASGFQRSCILESLYQCHLKWMWKRMNNFISNFAFDPSFWTCGQFGSWLISCSMHRRSQATDLWDNASHSDPKRYWAFNELWYEM